MTDYAPPKVELHTDEMEDGTIDPVIAMRVRDLREGLNGCRRHSYGALAIKVIGWDDQKGGEELYRMACKTLGLEW